MTVALRESPSQTARAQKARVRTASALPREWQPLADLRLAPDPALPLAPVRGDAARLTLAPRGTDEQLARRVAAEGDAPFAVLYERHREGLQRYCLSVVRDAEDAADAAHEAWLRAFAALRSPQMRPMSFRAWLFAIARNTCIDRLRDRSRFSLHEIAETDLGLGGSPPEELEAREGIRTLLGDLSQLSERQRSAIALREVAGLTVDEIAAALETTPSKAMSLIGEARRVLHERDAGRRLSCESVREQIDALRVQSHGIRAHLDQCSLCRSHHAMVRGRRLSSLALLPVGFLRPLLARLGGFVRHAAALEPVGARVAAAAGTVALAAGAGAALHAGAGQAPPQHRAPVRHAAASVGAGARVSRRSNARGHRSQPRAVAAIRAKRPAPTAFPAPRPRSGAAQAAGAPVRSAPGATSHTTALQSVTRVVSQHAPLVTRLLENAGDSTRQTVETVGAVVKPALAAGGDATRAVGSNPLHL